MNSRVSSARSCMVFILAFFRIEVAADGPELPLASRAERRTVCISAFWSISFMMIRVRRSLSAKRPWLSSPTYFFATTPSAGSFPAPPPPRAPFMPERSCCNSRLATLQPPFNGPTKFSLGTFTSVMKVSQNGEFPAIKRMGRISTPVSAIEKTTKEMPSCFLEVSVRTRQNIMSAYCAPLVQIFDPFTRKWSPLSSARV